MKEERIILSNQFQTFIAIKIHCTTIPIRTTICIYGIITICLEVYSRVGT